MCKHGCSICNHKGESILYTFLKQEFLDVETQVKFKWSQNMSFDFKVNNVLIELDGMQHFAPRSHWKTNWDVMEHDLIKEKLAIQHNFPVVRLLQKDVVSSNDWKDVLKKNIEVASQKIGVYTPNTKEYNSGVYSRLRCEESFF